MSVQRNKSADAVDRPFNNLLRRLNSADYALLAPHLQGPALERQCGPEADHADLDADVPERARKVLVPRRLEGLRRTAPGSFPPHGSPYFFLPPIPVYQVDWQWLIES